MKDTNADILARYHFVKKTKIDDLQEESGVFIISDCPLVETNPSKWNCTPLFKEFAENLKRDIKDIVIKHSLHERYKDLSFFFASNIPQENVSGC